MDRQKREKRRFCHLTKEALVLESVVQLLKRASCQLAISLNLKAEGFEEQHILK